MNKLLLEKYQVVRINNITSETKVVDYSVSQGTVLGPMLFNIYVIGGFSLRTLV